MGRVRAVALFSLLAIGAACGDSAFNSDQDADASAGDAGSDATSAVDAASDSSTTTTDASDEYNVPGNLLVDPSFESAASSGCGPFWVNANANTVLSISNIAHSGSASCLVCSTSTVFAALGANTNTEPLANLDAGLYEIVAWVMPMVDAGSPSDETYWTLNQYFPDGGQGPAVGAAVDPGAAWSEVTFDGNLVPDNLLALELLMLPAADAGPVCMLVDDVSLVKQ